MPARWVKKADLCRELGIGKHVAEKLIAQKKIREIVVSPTLKLYVLPELPPIQLDPPIERVAFLTLVEVGEILGLKRNGVKAIIHRNQLKTHSGAGQRLYVSIADLRQYLAFRERRKGPGKTQYSPIVIKWLKQYLEKKKVEADILDELIRAASPLQDPERGIYASKLWTLFDQVNALLQEIEKLRV